MPSVVVVNASLSIVYHANGGSGAPSSTQRGTQVSSSDMPVTIRATVSSSAPTRDGYDFIGWAYSSTATSASVSGGSTLAYTFTVWTGSSLSHTYTLYAVWSPKQYTVYYRPGAYSSESSVGHDIKYGGVDLTLRGAMYTRPGYVQSGWSTGSTGTSFAYSLNGTYSANAPASLYPYWSIVKSTISSVTSSVPADGVTEGTISINRPNSSFTHKVVIKLGSVSQTYYNVGTSKTFTIPSEWLNQIPSSTAAVASVELTTYNYGSQVGSPDVKSFTVTVPSSIIPAVSMSHENVSDNANVDSWDILVQGFSKIRLIATAQAGYGSTISSISFAGDGVTQTGSLSTVLSSVLTSSGDKTWTVTVKDARGRSVSASITRPVFEYHPASILALSAYRSDHDGNAAPSSGIYITVSSSYVFASCDGHNYLTVKKIEYKASTANVWIVGVSSASANTRYTFGTVSVIDAYDVRLTVTDVLGGVSVYVVNLPSVSGVSFGLNGKCARFGGPVIHPDRLHCDWPAQFDDDISAPKHIQSGFIASKDVQAGSTDVTQITFDTEFDTPPNIVAGLLSNQTYGMGVCSASIWNGNERGFTLRLNNGYSSSRKLGAYWIAISSGSRLPRIMEQPVSQTVSAGSSVTFTIYASGAESYQWYVLEANSSSWEEITGADSDTVTITATASMNGNMYKCVVSNAYGGSESATALLTVN